MVEIYEGGFRQRGLDMFLRSLDSESVLEEFIEKSGLGDPISRVDVSAGTMLYWGEGSHVLFFLRESRDFRDRIFGGTEIVESLSVNYFLEGKLNGERVRLEANYMASRLSEDYESSGHSSSHRRDNHPYWFLVEPKKSA